MNVIRESTLTLNDLPFVNASTRIVGDGEEFCQQIYHLLDENERAFMNDEEKGTIVLHDWAFEALKGLAWALSVANQLYGLAMKDSISL